MNFEQLENIYFRYSYSQQQELKDIDIDAFKTDVFNWIENNAVTIEQIDRTSWMLNNILRNKIGTFDTIKPSQHKDIQQQVDAFVFEMLEQLNQKTSFAQFTQKDCFSLISLFHNSDNFGDVLLHLESLGVSSFDKYFWSFVYNKKDVQAGQFLYKHSVTPDLYQDNWLHNITTQNELAVVKSLPEEYLKQFVHTTNAKGETPLHNAAQNLFPEHIEFLLKLGADPKATTLKGKLPTDLIKRTKSKMNKLDAVLELLGGGNKTPKQWLEHASKSYSVAILEKMGKEQVTELFEISYWDHIFVETLNTHQLKSIRKMQGAFLQRLLDWDIPLPVLSKKNTVLHLAIVQGACECIDMILEKYPHLAHNRNAQGLLPEQMKSKSPHVLSKYEPNAPETYDRYKDERITQLKIAKLYVKHHIEFLEDAFPLLISEEHQAYLQKHRLKMSLKGIETTGTKKRKM